MVISLKAKNLGMWHLFSKILMADVATLVAAGARSGHWWWYAVTFHQSAVGLGWEKQAASCCWTGDLLGGRQHCCSNISKIFNQWGHLVTTAKILPSDLS